MLRAKVTHYFGYGERKFQGTKVPQNESYRGKVRGSEGIREKVP